MTVPWDLHVLNHLTTLTHSHSFLSSFFPSPLSLQTRAFLNLSPSFLPLTTNINPLLHSLKSFSHNVRHRRDPPQRLPPRAPQLPGETPPDAPRNAGPEEPPYPTEHQRGTVQQPCYPSLTISILLTYYADLSSPPSKSWTASARRTV